MVGKDEARIKPHREAAQATLNGRTKKLQKREFAGAGSETASCCRRSLSEFAAPLPQTANE
jgi:hypothetical protein